MRTAVLLVNLGSPDSPDEADVRRYLAEFLHDPFVIDYPAWVRRLIVDGIVLRRRPARTGALYRSIWTEEGAPLIVNTQRLVASIAEHLPYPTAMAMRYGNPSIEAVMHQLLRDHPDLEHMTLVPLYPQAAMATTHTVVVEVERVRREIMPNVSITVVKPWYDHPRVLDLLAGSIREHVSASTDAVVLSYHGVPVRHLKKMDPTRRHCAGTDACCTAPSPAHESCYRHQCLMMTNGIADRLNIDRAAVHMTFQSRFGPDQWLDPPTDATVADLAARGARNIVLASPAFVADCLETLEELNVGTRRLFMDAGGASFTYVPCLNNDPAWVDTLASIITPYLSEAS